MRLVAADNVTSMAESYDNDETCCRWCSQSFKNLRGRQRHENDEHKAEYKGTYSFFKQKGYYDSHVQEFAELVMCELCSVFTQKKVGKQDAHKRSAMHVSKKKQGELKSQEYRERLAADVKAKRNALDKCMKTVGGHIFLFNFVHNIYNIVLINHKEMSVASSGVEVRVAAASIEAEGKKKKDLKATLLSPSSQAQALTSSCSGLFPTINTTRKCSPLCFFLTLDFT